MDSINISKFKAKCLQILAELSKRTEPLEITKNGEPLVIIYPASIKKKGQALFGCMQGSGEIIGDIVEPIPLKDQGWQVLK
jgi:prevent-host-death family protein